MIGICFEKGEFVVYNVSISNKWQKNYSGRMVDWIVYSGRLKEFVKNTKAEKFWIEEISTLVILTESQ